MSGIACFRIEAPTSEWDRLAGELHALHTLGIEEREAQGLLLAYFRDGRSARDAVHALGDPARGVRVHPPERVPERDWSAAWRAGLAPRRIGPIWVRPSWCARAGTPELVIDPEQAFGSGEHATTRLALELLAESLRPGDRVLDVGSGSGILGLAALRLGARAAFGLELEPAACRNASDNARRNRLPLRIACASPEALRAGAGFDVVVANLLLLELEPCLASLVTATRRVLVVSGQLAAERSRLRAALRAVGASVECERSEPQTGETWIGSVVSAAHARPLQASSSASSVSSKG